MTKLFLYLAPEGLGTSEIHYEAARYSLRPKFGPEATLRVADETLRLDQLVDRILDFDPDKTDVVFSLRGQMDIGTYLYDQTIGSVVALRRLTPDDEVELRIVTDDDHLLHLPWSLLYDRNQFLSATKWSVAFTEREEACHDQRLFTFPKILVIAPEPGAFPPTDAKEHISDFEALVAPETNPLSKRVRVVTTFKDTRTALVEFAPHIVYYYGHGDGNRRESSLAFEADANVVNAEEGLTTGARTGPEGEVAPATRSVSTATISPTAADAGFDPCSAANFARALNELSVKPILLYINCCSGDAGGILGVGPQLLTAAPVVITNCTRADVVAARRQALVFWRAILIEGKSPHRAITDVRAKVISQGGTYDDLRWMTPVLHYRYSNWFFQPPVNAPPVRRRIGDPMWKCKLDRVSQFSQVLYQTQNLLLKPGSQTRALAYLWYGLPRNGMEHFADRIEQELPTCLPQLLLKTKRPAWPLDYDAPNASFQDMMWPLFDVPNFANIRAGLLSLAEELAHDKAKECVLLYLRHRCVQRDEITLERLRSYLEWLDTDFLPELPENISALFGFPFMHPEPEAFGVQVLSADGLADLETENIHLSILEPMRSLNRYDLLDFVRTAKLKWPRRKRDRLVEQVLRESHAGQYDLVIDAMQEAHEDAVD